MKHKQEEYWRPRPYMRLALVCWRSNGECTFTDMQKIEKRGEKRV